MPTTPPHCVAAELHKAMRSGGVRTVQPLRSGRAPIAPYGIGTAVLAIARMAVGPSGDQHRVEHLLHGPSSTLAYDLRFNPRLLHGASSSPLVLKIQVRAPHPPGKIPAN